MPTLLWTAVLADELYRHLDEKDLLLWEQKGCRKGSRDTKDQLLIDKTIVKNCKRILTSLGVAWVDYSKVYDIVLRSWIEKSMRCSCVFPYGFSPVAANIPSHCPCLPLPV